MIRIFFVIVGLLLLAWGCAEAPASRPAAKKEVISTDKAPAAIGPYSQAIRHGDFLYLAGQIPLDPQSGKMVEGGIEAQTHQVLKNLQAVLEAAGYGFEDVVQTQVFLKDLNDYGAMNAIYADYLGDQPPARAVVEVSRIPRDAMLEMMMVAIKSGD